jgi:hypothetical protein
MSARLPVFPAVAVIVLALAVAAAAFSNWDTNQRPQHPSLTLAGDDVKLVQSRADEALIKLPNAKPGQVARGSAVIGVTGHQASVAIGAQNLSDVAGLNGGKLIASRHLWIDVRCTGLRCPGSPVAYRGPLSQMGTRSLGTWQIGTARRYNVRVWLARGGQPRTGTTGDNAFQGSRAKFGLRWTAIAS